MIVLPHPGPNGDGESDDGDSDDEKMSDEEVKILLAQIGDTLANHLLPVPLMHILIVIDGEGPKLLPEALRAMADALDGTDRGTMDVTCD